MSAWKILFFFSVLYGLVMVVFTLGQELLSFTSPKKLKDTWVKAKVKSQVIIHCISLPSESWNDSGKVSISLKTILITDVANLRFLELWGRGTSSLIQPTTTKYIFCLEVSKRIPPAVITPECMLLKTKIRIHSVFSWLLVIQLFATLHTNICVDYWCHSSLRNRL